VERCAGAGTRRPAGFGSMPSAASSSAYGWGSRRPPRCTHLLEGLQSSATRTPRLPALEGPTIALESGNVRPEVPMKSYGLFAVLALTAGSASAQSAGAPAPCAITVAVADSARDEVSGV